MEDQKPFRCFDRAYLMKIAIAIAAILSLAFAAKAFPRGSAERLALVALESAVMGYVIVLTVGTIRRLDELNQRIHLVAIAASFAVTGIAGTGLALLEDAGLRVADWEELLWLFMCVAWGIGVLVIQRRYR